MPLFPCIFNELMRYLVMPNTNNPHTEYYRKQRLANTLWTAVVLVKLVLLVAIEQMGK